MTALLPQEDYDNNERRCQMYESQLHGVGGEPYLKYLMEDRGLSLETIKHFRLGAVVNPDPQDHKFQYRICIPHMNLRGVSVLRFRAAPGQSGPKYLQPTGSRISVYNVAQLSEPLDYVAVCEGECLPGSAEVFTQQGWSRLDELEKGVPVAQYDASGTLSFVNPISYIEKPYDGELIEYTNSRRYYSLTTPGHGMPGVSPAGKLGKYRADEGAPSSRHIPRVGVLDGSGTGVSKDQLALMLAISADAAVRFPKGGKQAGRRRKAAGNRYYVFGFTKVRKVVRLTQLLERLGIAYSSERIKGGYQSICFSSTPEIEWMGRMLPHDMLSKMSLSEREFCLEEMTEWDGNSVPNRNQHEYSSKHLANAEWMQTLAHTAGRTSTIMARSNAYGKWYKVSVLHDGQSTGWRSLRNNERRVPFSGTVYCVQVPSGFFLVRQNGCITVTGNCDAMTLTQCGYPAVGFPGASTWRDHHAYMFDGYQRVFVLGDGDDAGEEFASKVARHVPNPRVITLPDNQDVNGLYVEQGIDAIHKLLGIKN